MAIIFTAKLIDHSGNKRLSSTLCRHLYLWTLIFNILPKFVNDSLVFNTTQRNSETQVLLWNF